MARPCYSGDVDLLEIAFKVSYTNCSVNAILVKAVAFMVLHTNVIKHTHTHTHTVLPFP